MAFLHYGPDLRLQLDQTVTKRIMEAVASHATRGGWVTATDVEGRDWSFLVTAGIPIWINEHE